MLKKTKDSFELIVGIIWLIIVAIAIGNTIITKEFIYWIKYTAYIGSFIFAVLVFFGILFIIKKGFSKPKTTTILFIFSTPILSGIGGLAYYSLALGIKDLYLWSVNFSHTITGSIVYTILLTLILGIVLFIFRLKLRALYGLVEAITGFIVAGYKVYNVYTIDLNNIEFYLAILTAGIFLVVRGFDNIHHGFTKEPKDPIAIKILNKYLNKDKIE